MHKTYKIYLPGTEGSIEEEYRQCLEQINETCSSGYIPLKLNFFIDVSDFKIFFRVRSGIFHELTRNFPGSCPAFNVTCHPPEKPWKVTVEGLFIRSESAKVTSKMFGDIPYNIVETRHVKEVWAAGISSYSFPDDTRKAAEHAFDMMVSLLAGEKMSMDNLVRQWNYIGNILDVKNGFQNYQIFNEVRSECYGRYRKIESFPAATGVGMKHGGVILDFYAITSNGHLKVIPVKNPNQVNPYEYSQKMLKGTTANGMKIKHPPQFERALLVSGSESTVLIISGTASIVGQETIGRGDVAEQTVVTIENINKLKDLNLISQIPGISNPEHDRFALLRVYIKMKEDFNTVKLICEDTFPGIPKVYIEADICRDELLTEIEAEYLL